MGCNCCKTTAVLILAPSCIFHTINCCRQKIEITGSSVIRFCEIAEEKRHAFVSRKSNCGKIDICSVLEICRSPRWNVSTRESLRRNGNGSRRGRKKKRRLEEEVDRKRIWFEFDRTRGPGWKGFDTPVDEKHYGEPLTSGRSLTSPPYLYNHVLARCIIIYALLFPCDQLTIIIIRTSLESFRLVSTKLNLEYYKCLKFLIVKITRAFEASLARTT